jgi:hypothetical protein
LEAISGVTETSRGTIERVAATQLQKELSALVDKPVIATGTMAMVCLPNQLHFKGMFFFLLSFFLFIFIFIFFSFLLLLFFSPLLLLLISR